MNNRVPNGNRRLSTDTISLEEGRPEAVRPGPVWQVTSNTPSRVPGLFAELLVGAARVVGMVVDAGDVAAASAPVDAGGAAGVPVAWQPLNSTAPASATVGRTRVIGPVMPCPAGRGLRPGTPRMVPRREHFKPRLGPSVATSEDHGGPGVTRSMSEGRRSGRRTGASLWRGRG
jgi:hypothetical protein